MFKKLMALSLAAILLCLTLVGCAATGEETPDGMQPAHMEGEPFRLYIPEGWSVNTVSGISGGFSYATERVIANARYHAPDNPDTTAEDYLRACADRYATTLKDFKLLSLEAATVGKEENLRDAKALSYTAMLDNVAYTCTQYTAKHEGLLISLYFYAPTDSLDMAKESFAQIRTNFVLTSLPSVTSEPFVDDNTPAGMQIASGKDAAHRLYVPMSWSCDPDSGRSFARVGGNGSPNVSVTLYEPTDSMTAADYVSLCHEKYSQSLSGYELLSQEDCQIAGRTGKVMTYRASYDGIAFRLQQTIFSDGRVIYSLTYTATDDTFDAYLADVNAIREAFTFR